MELPARALEDSQRSHYVIINGGDQPNVVPSDATVWYYFREIDYAHVNDLWSTRRHHGEGAALMTGTTFTSRGARRRLASARQSPDRGGNAD